MRKVFAVFLCGLFLAGCTRQMPMETTVATLPSTAATVPVTTEETTQPTTEATLPPIVLDLSEEDQQQLLMIGMAELGATECQECVALVMCTVLNRVNSGRFGSSIYKVLHAPGQFTPVGDGSYDKAQPNDTCHAALDMVMRGWDESQGALYYEFCEGPSWHSKNLKLLTQHCNTRFYQG